VGFLKLEIRKLKFVLKIGFALLFLYMTGCWQQVHQDKDTVPHQIANPAANPDEFYQQIRSRWTIRLGPGSEHAGKTSGPPGGREEGGGGLFPLTIRATLMVDEVIDAGLLYYKQIAEMSVQEADTFGRNYREGNQLDRYLLVESFLQTSSAENYLDLRRYTIYIEDDQHNKVEPAKIVERSIVNSSQPGFTYEPGRRQELTGFTGWMQHQKTVLLYFPKRDIYEKPILAANIKELKIVFILDERGSGRVEGKWVFPE
jgi:hypothetical protein